MKRLLLICLLAIVSLTPAPGREEGSASGGVQLRAFAFALSGGADELELRREKSVLGTLELSEDQLGERIVVKARQFTCGVLEGENFKPLAAVKLPEKGRDFILVFAPTKTGYRVFPVRADDPEFRGNDTWLFNFSPYKLGIMLGTAKQAVESTKNARLRPAFPEGATFFQALFTYEKNGKYVPFNNTRWPVNSNTKSLLFVYENPENGRLAYRSVIELAK